MAVRAVLGTMTYGPDGQTKPEQALEQLLMFIADSAGCGVTAGPGAQETGQVLVDTARGYQSGATEETIGTLLAAHPELRSKISIATKAAPPLDRAAIREKCEASLAALQTDHVDLYYLHSPDVSVDLDETLSTMNSLHEEGKFKEFGLSNYAGWEVVDIWHRCKEKGWVLPTVYQGMYNGITRDCEKHLFPALRRVGMRFYGYNPLAGGLLTGKYTGMDDPALDERGRFSSEYAGTKENPNPSYRGRYFKPAVFDAIGMLTDACNASGVSMADAAMRWCKHHSILDASVGDGIIFGASSSSHAEHNIAAYGAGPLPGSIVEAMDAAWEVARPDTESYFRGYGEAPGGIEKVLAAPQARI